MKKLSLISTKQIGGTRLVAGALALFATASFTTTSAQAQKAPVQPAPAESNSALETWWNGKYISGNWFGFRDTLKENGISLYGTYSGAYFGVVDAQRGSRGFYDQELAFNGAVNVGKLLRAESLEGLHLETIGRWRDPSYDSNPNNFILGNGLFNASPWQSGTGWRFQSVAFEWNSKKLFSVNDMIQLRGGWVRPATEFIDQPLSKLFMNNAITSGKGIGGNIPFSSSFSTWGGSLRVRPTDWSYTKLGLYMSYPQSTASGNHGLSFQGFAQDPDQNGLMTMIESGVTPKIGASKLPGKYAMGAYYYGGYRSSFLGSPGYGQYGFYWQADQMLFREPSASVEEPAPMGKGATSKSTAKSSGKSFKAPVPASQPKLSEQGLSMFNLVTLAPKYNNMIPFYYQGGFSYKGLIPSRDKDQLYIGTAVGAYSYYNLLARRAAGSVNLPTYTMVIEGGYRVNFNDWFYGGPFAEYIIRPNGTDNIQNALVLGANFQLKF